MRHLKTTLAVLGAATILVLAGNTISLAATGHAFILGNANSANKITSLTRTTVGPALRVTTRSTANPPFQVNGHGKVTNLNADTLDGIDSSGFVRAGGAGAALGYAHILPNGSIDATRSWKVSASNLASTATGFYCFHGLSFTPRSGSVTLDYNGSLNGQIPVGQLRLPAAPVDCGLATAQAEVFTGDVVSSSSTVGKDIGYYIVFY